MAEMMNGLAIAVVCAIDDPMGLGQVKLSFPWLDTPTTSGWARVVGGVDLDIGDEVAIGFLAGEFNQPIVLGRLKNLLDG